MLAAAKRPLRTPGARAPRGVSACAPTVAHDAVLAVLFVKLSLGKTSLLGVQEFQVSNLTVNQQTAAKEHVQPGFVLPTPKAIKWRRYYVCGSVSNLRWYWSQTPYA